MNNNNFTLVTEQPGQYASKRQLQRASHRYHWAREYCHGENVLEIACGSGQGLGILGCAAKSLHAADISPVLLSYARHQYGERITTSVFDASSRFPHEDGSFEVIVFFEALYYLPDFSQFLSECYRVLRSDGKLLIATANPGLFDFNASPFSTHYFTVPELNQLLQKSGFKSIFYGDFAASTLFSYGGTLRLFKFLAVKLNLIPKSMNGKRFLKRIFQGNLTQLPPELPLAPQEYVPPTPISGDVVNRTYTVIYIESRK